jgi:hypothetical protein
MLSSMFGRPRFGISYGINFYLVTLMVAAFCLVEPYLGSMWSRAESWLESQPGACYLLRPLLYASGLLFFVIFDDRSTRFIYFQF